MFSPHFALAAAALTGLSTASPPPPPSGIDFGPCPPGISGELSCGTVEVPLDPTRSAEDTISIAVSRLPATGTPAERRGSLLVNPGGPGNSGLDYAAEKGAKLPESVRRSYDIIGFDPRGTGHSTPIHCGPMGGLFDHPRPDPVPTNETEEREHLNRLRTMAEDCRDHIGPTIDQFNTVNTAHDMDHIRAALGEPKLNLLGVSYGSYLGAAYGAEFPHHVGRMVLDSVVGPDPWHDFDRDQGFAMLHQRDLLFDWIAAHPDHDLGTDRGTVRAHYLRARAQLAEQPTPDGTGAAEFDRFVYRTLSRTERWAPFAEALSTYVHTGDQRAFPAPEPEDTPESRNREAALRTVKCADSPRPSSETVLDTVRALREADDQPLLTGVESEVCPFWPEPVEPARFGHPDMPPILLTQAEFDPTTPLDGARRMQDVLPGSRMATLRDSYSHGVFASQRSTCLDNAAATYLVDGVLPPADLDCPGPGLPE